MKAHRRRGAETRHDALTHSAESAFPPAETGSRSTSCHADFHPDGAGADPSDSAFCTAPNMLQAYGSSRTNAEAAMPSSTSMYTGAASAMGNVTVASANRSCERRRESQLFTSCFRNRTVVAPTKDITPSDGVLPMCPLTIQRTNPSTLPDWLSHRAKRADARTNHSAPYSRASWRKLRCSARVDSAGVAFASVRPLTL